MGLGYVEWERYSHGFHAFQLPYIFLIFLFCIITSISCLDKKSPQLTCLQESAYPGIIMTKNICFCQICPPLKPLSCKSFTFCIQKIYLASLTEHVLELSLFIYALSIFARM